MAYLVGMQPTRTPQVAAPIVVEGLTKRFVHRPVDDLSFAVRAGAVTGFLGPNGAGKTTALKMIVGLARPTRMCARQRQPGRARWRPTPAYSAFTLSPAVPILGARRAIICALAAALAGLPRGRVAEALALVG